MGGGQNYEKYWVGGRNLLPIKIERSILDQRHNDFCTASIIAKNCTEVPPYKKNILLEKSKGKMFLTSWIAWIMSYMEENLMDTIFCVYDTDIKTQVYLLDDSGVYKDGKV